MTTTTAAPAYIEIDGYMYRVDQATTERLNLDHPAIFPGVDGDTLPADYGQCVNCGDSDDTTRPAFHNDDMGYATGSNCYDIASASGLGQGADFRGLCDDCGPCSHRDCHADD